MEQALLPINDIIGTGWKFYKKNFVKFLKPLGILILPYILILTLNYSVRMNLLDNAPILGVSTFIALILFILFDIWMMIYMIKLADKLLKKQKIDQGKLFLIALKKIPSLIWIAILNFLIILGGFILFIIPGIFWSMWYSYSAYANIIEDGNIKGIEALIASKKLVKRRAWDTFGRSLFPVLFVEFFLYLGAGLIFLILYASGLQVSLAFWIVYIIMMILVFILIPLFYSFQVIVYNNLKETRGITFSTKTTVK
jgi:uncharacterized membrane protein YesL